MLAKLFHRSRRSRRPRGDAQEVCALDFEADGGRRWSAVGGGATVAEAIAFARDSLPLGFEWRLVRAAPLFGD